MSEQRSYRNYSPDVKYPANTDSINESALRELYIKLLSNYKTLNQEKINLMEKEKKNRIIIQELKNENGLLKQTIENEKLLKYQFLEKQNSESKAFSKTNIQNEFNHDNNITSNKNESFNEVVKNMKAEYDKLKKDLVLSQAIANNFKTELENIKVLNQNYKSENELLNGNIKELKLQLDKINLKKKEIENEYNKNTLEMDKIKKENIKIQEMNKNKSAELISKFKELSQKYENNNESTLSRHAELTVNNEKLALQLEALNNQIKKLDEDKNEIISELNFERENITHMQQDIDEKEEVIKKLRKENAEFNKKLKELLETNKNIMKNCSCQRLEKLNEEKEARISELKNQIEDLKKQVVTEKKKIEEMLQIQNEKGEDFIFERKLNKEEKLKLTGEIDRLTKIIEQYESEYPNLEKQKYLLESEINNLKENLEKFQSEKDLIESNRNSIQKDFNQLSNQYNFLKEKLEKEIKIKNDEITDYEKNVESLKKEIIKLKENRKSLQFQTLNNEDFVSNLQNKISEFETKEKEAKLKLKDYEILIFEKNNLEKSIEECKKIINYLESQNKDGKVKQENLLIENNNLKNENFRLINSQAMIHKDQNNKLEELNKKIIDDLNQEIKKINELNSSLAKEKENLISNSFNYKMEINSKQEMIEKIFKENKSLNEIILNIKSGFYTLFSELKINMNKVYSLIKKENKNIFQEISYEKINHILSRINLLKNENLDNNIIDITINSLTFFSYEFDSLYEKFLQADNILYQSNTINQVDKMTIERSEFENEKLINRNEELMNEINALNLEIEKYKDQQRIMNSELSGIRKNEICDFNTKKKHEEQIQLLTKEQKDLKEENKKIITENENLISEKKNFEDFLSMIAKNFPSKSISKLIIEYLSIKDCIRKNVVENKKIQDRIMILEQEFNNLNKEKTLKNSDLIKNVKTERENLKTLSYEYEKKYSEKKEQIKFIEKDLISQLIEFKNKIERNINYNIQPNEYSEIDKKSNKDYFECNLVNKNSSFHTRNNSEFNFNRDKYSHNASLISYKSPLNSYNKNLKNLNNSKYSKSNGFSNFIEDKINDSISNHIKVDSEIYEPKTSRAMLNLDPNYNDYRFKYETIRNSPSRLSERNNYENKYYNHNKSNISNLEITSIESLNNYNNENTKSNKQSKYEIDLNKYNVYENKDLKILENFSEEQIINDHKFDFKINKTKKINQNNNSGYIVTFKNDSVNNTQENNNGELNRYKTNYNYLNRIDNSLEDLMNLKSSEIYKNDTLILNSDTNYHSGYKDTLEVLERKKNVDEYEN